MSQMQVAEYGRAVLERTTTPKTTMRLLLELFEETGHVTTLIRKAEKKNYSQREIVLDEMKKEIGDVLVCIVQLLSTFTRFSLEEIARINLRKTHIDEKDKDVELLGENLDFEEYKNRVINTYRKDLPKKQKNQNQERAKLFAMGLVKEMGEIADLFGENIINKARLKRYNLAEKLGDLLWYVVALCETYDIDLQEVLEMSLEQMRTKKEKKEDDKIFQGDSNISFQEYEEGTADTVQAHINEMAPEDQDRAFILGMFEEGGEVTELLADQELDIEHLEEEMGDVLWYLTQLVIQLRKQHEIPGMNLEKIARINLEKTHIRYKKNLTITEGGAFNFNDYVVHAQNTYKEDLPESPKERLEIFAIGVIKEIGKISAIYGGVRMNSQFLDADKVIEKIGATLWYLAAIAQTTGVDLGKIASANMEKAKWRKQATEAKKYRYDNGDSEKQR